VKNVIVNHVDANAKNVIVAHVNVMKRASVENVIVNHANVSDFYV